MSYETDLSLKTPHPGIDSPGSSVFDLPIQNSITGVQPSAAHTPLAPHTAPTSPAVPSPSFVVVSGGTGGNAICSAFDRACYVLPVSDDGGSSSEIIRVLGGPSIGDIRSRLVRLIPAASPASPLGAIRALLAYRLPARCTEREAREEWRDIVEGRSTLWTGIPNDRKEAIRGFLVYFESEILKRAHKGFSFLNGRWDVVFFRGDRLTFDSIGNYFLAAAQGFFRSLPSAIFLFSSITSSQANIVPVIVTNHTVTIAAELENGERLVGQCEISHPVAPAAPSISVTITEPWSPVDGMGEVISQRNNVMFDPQTKAHYEVLQSRISRLLYINGYGHEVHPSPNPEYISSLSSSDALVYSCGSLWTSIIPCLALRGVSTAIARSRSLRAKILLLNSANDRETDGYTAADYVNVIVRTLNGQYHVQPYGLGNVNTMYPVSAFVTDLVYLKGTAVAVDVKQITSMGVRCTEVDGEVDEESGTSKFDAGCVRRALGNILKLDDD